MAPVLSILATGLMAINGALAHPGHSVQQEAAERGQWLRARQPNSVRSCAGELQRRGHLEAALARRQELAKHARVKRNLPAKRFERRDFAEYNISHASDLDVTLGSDETLLFADNSSCILQPEVTQGRESTCQIGTYSFTLLTIPCSILHRWRAHPQRRY